MPVGSKDFLFDSSIIVAVIKALFNFMIFTCSVIKTIMHAESIKRIVLTDVKTIVTMII